MGPGSISIWCNQEAMNNSDQMIWMIPVAVVSVAVAAVFSAGGGEAGLRRRAESQGLQLISVERRRFDKGPFLFRTGKNGKIYYFVARNDDGLQRGGFARVKPPMSCVFSDPVTVQWDDVEWQ